MQVSANEPGGDVQRRGTLGAMHALGLLDVDGDAVLEAVASLAGRVGRGRCQVWLRGAGGRGDLRPVTGDPAAGPVDEAVVVPIAVEGIEVGEVRGHKVTTTVARHTAAQVAEVLAVRWAAARVDDAGNPLGVVTVDRDLTVIWTSPETDQIGLGADGGPMVGRPVLDYVDAEELGTIAGLLDRGLGGRGRTAVVAVNLVLRDHGPTRFDIWGDNRLADPCVEALTFVLRRAADERGELALLGDQMWVLNRLSRGEPLGEVLHRVTDLIEHRDPRSRACIMELDAVDRVLHPLIAPHLPVPVVGALIGLEVGPDAPAGGGSVHVDIAQYAPNVASDPAYASIAPVLTAHGLHACWSMPIRSIEGEVELGSIDVYRTVVGNPDDADTRVLSLASRLAAIAMDHDTRERALRHQAMHDPLTDLPNRAMFAERLAHAASDGNVGMLFVDLDRFKLVNDTLGHEFGDEVLKVIGRRMAEAVEEPVLVARFGGDEFTVLVPKVDMAAELVAVGHRLLAAISEPFEVRGHRVVLGASAGAALAAEAPDDPQALVRDADTALYHAKDRGRGRVEVFDDRMREADAERMRIEQLLRQAVEHDGIEVHFQPTVRIADGRPVGAEALARCTCPGGEEVGPDRFIPVAQEVGLLPRVFETVLTRACEMTTAWNRGRSDPFVVWVNLSPSQLGSSAVVEQIARVFETSGVDPSHIGFEVTESGILPDPTDASAFLTELRSLGAHLAIDDFGTGYSSLGYLQELPVDTVKLDRSFVVRAGDDHRSRAIVGGIVELARAMGLHSVAEGVETVEQLEVVEALGCEVVQGFVYARPCPPEQLTDWLATRV
jgi:diguanylate cyclase (GGDEF)-like protein